MEANIIDVDGNGDGKTGLVEFNEVARRQQQAEFAAEKYGYTLP